MSVWHVWWHTWHTGENNQTKQVDGGADLGWDQSEVLMSSDSHIVIYLGIQDCVITIQKISMFYELQKQNSSKKIKCKTKVHFFIY